MKRTPSSGTSAQPLDFRDFAAARGCHLVRTAFLLTGGDAHLAEDLAQETLARLFARWRKISRLDNPTAYAQTVLVNTFLTHRRRRSSGEHVTSTFSEQPVHDTEPELRLALLKALGELPVQDRTVLVLRYWEDRSVEETAAMMRLSASGVRSRAARALVKLRTALGEELEQFAEL
ncbi:SigE family RNA polymerase sigma factor [Kitasatospora acidiphila]|uniref:SigE family RNA polymerase sigma factor n=1 Tax=Kitasatospora acidiphila TaxID=2567942 RepID=A0A540W8Z7_9ACTN|nr:SigE family RNA polymerase sigma factor [Kitasatospora acidiphila]TQF05509.1 SigE family RNA polymerase sigma factor [Kitasatospora acidiphila]